MIEIKSKKMKAVLFLVVGLGAGIYSFNLYSTATESESWPTVKGDIIDSGANRVHKVQTGKSKWEAHVNYKYSVNEMEYENDRVKFGVDLSYDSYQLALKSISGYPSGGRVPVYYDPINPQNSTLEIGVSFFTYLGFGFSALIIMIGLGFLISKD